MEEAGKEELPASTMPTGQWTTTTCKRFVSATVAEDQRPRAREFLVLALCLFVLNF
jgi:hypothetical protein